MSFWTLENVRAATGGTWLARRKHLGGAPICEGVSADTRTLKEGEAYVALRGERFDGHDFLQEAIHAGASLLIVDSQNKSLDKCPKHVCALCVDDTGEALLRLARAYRRSLEGVRVVAVTGSNGKTTTVRLIASMLEGSLRGVVSEKSFNNRVGAPLTILRAKPGDQYLVCEVGSSSPGEIAELGAIIEPDVAVITSVGRAHLEGLGSVEGVVIEKASLLAFVRQGGVAVAPADAETLAEYLRPIPNVVTFGRSPGADLRLSSVRHAMLDDSTLGLKLVVNARVALEAPMIGEHHAMNIMAAVAVARRFGLEQESIALGLRRFKQAPMRLELEHCGDVMVLNDAYNANPESTAAAIDTFLDVASDAKRRILILGDMLELGDAAAAAHVEIAQRVIGARGIDLVVTVGPLMGATARLLVDAMGVNRVLSLADASDAEVARCMERIEPGDAALLKGSRGMRLERFQEAIEARHASAPGQMRSASVEARAPIQRSIVDRR